MGALGTLDAIQSARLRSFASGNVTLVSNGRTGGLSIMVGLTCGLRREGGANLFGDMRLVLLEWQ